MKLSFGTVKITVVGGGKPMGGENNWFCIFEADWGCMVTAKNSQVGNKRTPRRPFFLFGIRLELAAAQAALSN